MVETRARRESAHGLRDPTACDVRGTLDALRGAMRAIALALLALAACDSSRADPPPVASEHDAIQRFHMREHYVLLGAVQHLAIRGYLYEAQVIARVIANAPDEPGFARWSSQMGFARGNARELSMAPSSEEACRRIARLAATCAQCHLDAKVSAIFGSPPAAPPEGATLDARMARHVWAADRLYEGILGPADASWRAGLDVLARSPVPWPVVDGDRAALSRRLQDLADQARTHAAQDDLAARARTYGEILVTCSACHATRDHGGG